MFEGLYDKIQRSLNFFKDNLRYFQFLALEVRVS